MSRWIGNLQVWWILMRFKHYGLTPLLYAVYQEDAGFAIKTKQNRKAEEEPQNLFLWQSFDSRQIQRRTKYIGSWECSHCHTSTLSFTYSKLKLSQVFFNFTIFCYIHSNQCISLWLINSIISTPGETNKYREGFLVYMSDFLDETTPYIQKIKHFMIFKYKHVPNQLKLSICQAFKTLHNPVII